MVGGSLGGRRLAAPAGSAVRPTSDRVRGAIANALLSMGVLEGARVLDCFAGSGALGIEALSRGAAHVTFVERDRRALAVLRANLTDLGLSGAATVVPRSVEAHLAEHATTAAPFDLAFADPPYAFDGWGVFLGAVPAPLVVIESDRSIELPGGWEARREQRHGGTVVLIAARRTGEAASPRPRT